MGYTADGSSRVRYVMQNAQRKRKIKRIRCQRYVANTGVMKRDVAQIRKVFASNGKRFIAGVEQVKMFDARGDPVRVSGRGEASSPPVRLCSDVLPGGAGTVVAWAGPWAHDVRWWDRVTRRRRVLWQVVVQCPVADGADSGAESVGDQVACLVAVEGGRAAVEAVYD